MKLPIVLLAFMSVVVAEEFPDCKCQRGFKPQKDFDGEVVCVGILMLLIIPCNIPERPKCKCGPEVKGIVINDTGTWCATFQEGKKATLMPCENPEEWEEYYDQFSRIDSQIK